MEAKKQYKGVLWIQSVFSSLFLEYKWLLSYKLTLFTAHGEDQDWFWR